MKVYSPALLLITASVSTWIWQKTVIDMPVPVTSIISPVIQLEGKTVDTTYLYAPYKDPGAGVLADVNGQLRCSCIPVEITGTVKTQLPGTHFLDYDAMDASGNRAATVTRTVHVVENSAGFLNGVYDVVCSCTTVAAGSTTSAATTKSYVAVVSTGEVNNSFRLVALDIGSEEVVPWTFLKGNSIEVSYFNAEYDLHSILSGTLSPAKNTFTIDSKVSKYSPVLMYTCKNIFTKRLIIKNTDRAGKEKC
jgi:hypothetical protein